MGKKWAKSGQKVGKGKEKKKYEMKWKRSAKSKSHRTKRDRTKDKFRMDKVENRGKETATAINWPSRVQLNRPNEGNERTDRRTDRRFPNEKEKKKKKGWSEVYGNGYDLIHYGVDLGIGIITLLCSATQAIHVHVARTYKQHTLKRTVWTGPVPSGHRKLFKK